MNIKYPDYDNSLLSLTSSILKHYGMECSHKSLPILDEALTKDYKNVVVMLFDGMGVNIMEKHLKKDGFLRSHCAAEISSVFPSTTASATTTMVSGLSPAEHGWLGWSLYFKEVDKNVSVFPNTITGSKGEPAADYHVANRYLSYKTIWDKINDTAESETEAAFVAPFSSHKAESVSDIVRNIKEICSQKGRKYIYSYWPNPDTDLHIEGTDSENVKNDLHSIETEIEAMCSGLEDTLIIVTADHGMTDIENKYLSDYPEIEKLLVRAPSIEARAKTFFIKEGCCPDFEKAFKEAFRNDYMLMTKDEVFQRNLFGYGNLHPRTKGFIGDYLAVAVGKTNLENKPSETRPPLKASHAGLTEEEMTIPLILIESK